MSHTDVRSHGIEPPDLLIGENLCDMQMQLLLRTLSAILTNTPILSLEDTDDEERVYPSELKNLSLQLLLTIVCVSNLVDHYL